MQFMIKIEYDTLLYFTSDKNMFFNNIKNALLLNYLKVNLDFIILCKSSVQVKLLLKTTSFFSIKREKISFLN